MGLFEWPDKEELLKRLKDYLEDDVDEKYFLSDKMMAYFTDMTDRNGFVRGARFNPHNLDSKYAFAITTNAGQRPTDNFVIMPEKTKKGYALAEEGDGVYIDRPHQKRGVVQKGIIQTIKTSAHDVGVVVRGGAIRNRPDENGVNQPNLELRKDELSNALTTFDKDNIVTFEDPRNLKEKLCDDLIESGIVKEGDVVNHSYTNSEKKPNSRLELEDFIETTDGIMPTLTTRGDTLGVVIPRELRYDEGIRTFKDGIMGTIRTREAGGDKVVIMGNIEVEVSSNNKRLNETADKIADADAQILDCYNKTLHKDVAPTITTRVNASNNTFLFNKLRIRKLTPKECFRLMSFDDEDHDKLERAGISNSQRYKMAGNSIVVRVLEKILKNLIESTL